jgi:hypothetical protein
LQFIVTIIKYTVKCDLYQKYCPKNVVTYVRTTWVIALNDWINDEPEMVAKEAAVW